MKNIIVVSTKELQELIKESIRDNSVACTCLHCGDNTLKAKEKKRKFYTRKDVADILNISLPTLHKYMKAGTIKSHKIGNRVLFTEEDINNAIKLRNFK